MGSSAGSPTPGRAGPSRVSACIRGTWGAIRTSPAGTRSCTWIRVSTGSRSSGGATFPSPARSRRSRAASGPACLPAARGPGPAAPGRLLGRTVRAARRGERLHPEGAQAHRLHRRGHALVQPERPSAPGRRAGGARPVRLDRVRPVGGGLLALLRRGGGRRREHDRAGARGRLLRARSGGDRFRRGFGAGQPGAADLPRGRVLRRTPARGQHRGPVGRKSLLLRSERPGGAPQDGDRR